MKTLKYMDLTEKIIGGVFEVHKFFGQWISRSNLSASTCM